jgi:predicted ribosome quality control (RQC) complex YloA/Tae2 family protein
MTPTLNWREIALHVDRLRPDIEGMFVDRIIVPERAYFPGGYIKGEWAIRLTSRRTEQVLLFSIRPRHPYFVLCEGKGPKAAQQATHSPFSLALSKHLKGAKLISLEALKKERMIVLWFTGENNGKKERLGLALMLIPATPEALLVRGGERAPWPVIARSRTIESSSFTPPDGSKAPDTIQARPKILENYTQAVEAELRQEAFELRLRSADRALRDHLKQAKERSRQNEVALSEAKTEGDWKRYGDLLKTHLPDAPPIQSGMRKVRDFETGKEVEIPSDPKLSAQAQVEKFFQLARRKTRRQQEAQNRLQTFQEAAARIEKLLAIPLKEGDWAALEKLERAAGVVLPAGGAAAEKKRTAKGQAWLGRSFASKDGLTIWVGRSRDENLELTFKHARGNDVWMHVRGKPGAHTLIPITSGKSVPLETLLDAAALTVFYSGGEKWGKTEVDYTFKKYVKRIKDSTEASYTNNKTLFIEPDPVRLKRLLSQDS